LEKLEKRIKDADEESKKIYRYEKVLEMSPSRFEDFEEVKL
jgi:hypothetical protein